VSAINDLSGGRRWLLQHKPAEKQNDAPEPTRTSSRVEKYAAEIRRRLESKARTGTAVDYLSDPLLDCDFAHIPSILLMGWICFDQLRPTLEFLYCTQIPGTDEGLLVFQRRDSYDRCRYAVYGLIPFDAGIEHIKEAAVALFRANGHPSLPLFHTLPTSIFHRENWQSDAPPAFNSGFTRTLFRFAAASLCPVNMATVCDHLRRNSDPWQWALSEHATRASGPDCVVQSKGTLDDIQFNEWFDLVTQPKHIEEERMIFRSDWQEEEVRRQKERRVIVN
jgi:hypothetical protein